MENVNGQSTQDIEATPDDLGVHSERAATLTRLGISEQKAGRIAEAESLFIEAIDVGDKFLGADHPLQRVALNELSRLLVRQAEHGRAVPLLERLLELARMKGERNSEVATVLAGLAVAKRGLGDDAAAEQLYRQALAIREEVLPPNHMVIVITMEQLSDTCAARGNLSEALALLQHALPRRECAVGAEHATVVAARARKVELARQMFEARIADLRRTAVPFTSVIVPIGATLTEPIAKVPAPIASPATEDAVVTPPERVAHDISALSPKKRRRKARVAAASGSVVVALMAIAGFTLGSHNRTVSGVAPSVTASEERMALVSRASDAPSRARARAGDAHAGVPTTSSMAGDSPSAAARVLALPNIRRLVVPKIAIPSPDSVIQISANGARDAELLSAGMASLRPATVRSDEPSVMPPTLIGTAPTPRFPDELRAQKVEGEVVVRFRVDEKGRVDRSSMQVVRSTHELFTDAVRNALSGFRFEPARSTARDATPQAAWVQFRTQFAARN